MGFENYDLIWQELEAVMKRYGYQLGTLSMNTDNDIAAIFSKEESGISPKPTQTCVACNHFGAGCSECKDGEDE